MVIGKIAHVVLFVGLLWQAIAAGVDNIEEYEIFLPGTIMLGGLLTVQTSGAAYDPEGNRSAINDYFVVCSQAFVYAIERANAADGALYKRSITLGLWALDTLDNDIVGIRNGAKFLANSGSAAESRKRTFNDPTSELALFSYNSVDRVSTLF